MAAAAPLSSHPPNVTALTPPSSSHGDAAPWGLHAAAGQYETSLSDKAATATHHQAQISPPMTSPPLSSSLAPPDAAHGNMLSADNGCNKPADGPAAMLSPALTLDPAARRASPSPDWPIPAQSNTMDPRKRPHHHTLPLDAAPVSEDSKWIHRDKLARIESAELEAAGIYVPRPRARSKQRRDRSQSRIARATESTDMGRGRAYRDSSNLLRGVSADASTTITRWDLRTADEISQDGPNHYFAANAIATGSSRIPVAITSPAPIPVDFLERGSLAVRKPTDNARMDAPIISFSKPRTRSASLSASDRLNGIAVAAARRSITDHSPTKKAHHRTSINAKTATPAPRPKTRSGPNKDSVSGRPPTRGADGLLASGKAPEGNPPWMVNSYKPDPRLPPDQQLLPTVAKRLQQEKWEKEGKFGDAYDRDLRPLNDHEFVKSPRGEPEKEAAAAAAAATNGHYRPAQDGLELAAIETQKSIEWPLKASASKSPSLKPGGSYSTMPKISDLPPSTSLSSPRPPTLQQSITPNTPQDVSRLPDASAYRDGKHRCGCCVVM
ncbi:hypothetical protein CDD82_7812 [Ophiocordyceps australis]|uniref:Uncharacterized protein n=1 Tax=Ophiocordyceps australis TaxID=1399860 RepID=A0A2C5XEC3_9HYPO|nr:hypothetical protein CDD82_7812 [Ophiocordyceps australis]